MVVNDFTKQFLNFFGVGAFTTTISIILYYIAFSVLELPLYSTYIVVYFFMIFLSYLLNAKITFKQNRNTKTLLKYYLIYLLGMLIGLSLLKSAEMFLPLSNFVLSVIVIIPRTIIVFFFTKLFVFVD